MYITVIGQAILKLWGFKDEQGNPQTSRKMSFSDISNFQIMLKMTELLIINSSASIRYSFCTC